MSNDIPAASREAVQERSMGVCEICRMHRADHMHHRKPRRFRDHSPVNLLHLCFLCHSDAHLNPRRYERGWQLRGHEDPSVVPVGSLGRFGEAS